MKPVSSWGAICGLAVLMMASCFDPPVYSPIPAIEFDKVEFVDVADPTQADSLIVTVRFKDGDGDMGLDNEETAPPYNSKYYYRFSDGSFITYSTKRTNPNYDTLPAFVHPYNCTNWEIATVNVGTPPVAKTDTFYYQSNPNHHNFYVDFFIKNSSGYSEFNWQTEFFYPNCGLSYDGRFPILSKDLSQNSPLDGSIRYAMTSVGFLALFSVKTLRLDISVQDRALNRSNKVGSGDFTLQQIKVKSGG